MAGAHRSGRLSASVNDEFAFDAERVSVGKRIRCDDAELLDRVWRVRDFGAAHPGLLPDVTAFADRPLDDVARVAAAEDEILAWLQDTCAHNALCHWNANVDNAWFWRDSDGALRCGLMDWGCVSVMNVAMALWGALCSAETDLWREHLVDLLEHFVIEFTTVGGPELDTALLRTQLVLYAVVMGVAWLLDTPRIVRGDSGSGRRGRSARSTDQRHRGGAGAVADAVECVAPVGNQGCRGVVGTRAQVRPERAPGLTGSPGAYRAVSRPPGQRAHSGPMKSHTESAHQAHPSLDSAGPEFFEKVLARPPLPA